MSLPLPTETEIACSHEIVARLTIDGEPVAKQRPRVMARGGKIWTFTPKETVQAERHILAVAAKATECALNDVAGRYALTLRFFSERPIGRKWTSDLDNLIKLVLDALTPPRGKGNRPKGPGLFWTDDRQVSQLHASRFDRQPHPRTEIVVYRIVAAGPSVAHPDAARPHATRQRKGPNVLHSL